MAPQMQNPGLQPRASRDQLVGCSHRSFTAPDWRWQLLADRYRLPSSMAREVAMQCFGERRDD